MMGLLDEDPLFEVHRIKSDDLKAALAFLEQRGDKLTQEEMSVLLRKQSDPQALLDAYAKLLKEKKR